MLRLIGWTAIIAGLLLAFTSGFDWFQQSQLIEKNEVVAQAIAEDWEDIEAKPALDQGIASSAEHHVGENIGELIIPRLGSIMPIVHGTDPDSLEKGVGHYVGYGTVKPGETGHTVLSGHRDTVFREVGDLTIGDKLYVRYQGNIYTYQIRKTWITDAEDRTVIVPYDKPILTLTTCYPFDFIGSAPDRYIIHSELIDIKKDTSTE